MPETAITTNELMYLTEKNQAPLSEVIAEWLDFEEREGNSDGESDYSDDMDDTGTLHKSVRDKYLTKFTLRNIPLIRVNTRKKDKQERN